MSFKSILLIAAAAFFAGPAMGASLRTRSAEIATNSVAACNAPNNGDYTEGHSCKFYSGPSDTSPVVDGTCEWVDDVLTCEA